MLTVCEDFPLLYSYFIYLSTVKSSVLRYKKKVLKTSQIKIKILFCKIAVRDPDRQLL